MAHGLTFRDVLEALANNNTNVGGGYIEHAGEQYIIRSTGLIQNIEDIENVKLGTQDGAPFFVKDVAEVDLGKELRTGAGTSGGKEAVLGTAILLYGENSRTVSHRVSQKIAEVNKSLPENVKITTLYDRTYLVERDIEDGPQEPAGRSGAGGRGSAAPARERPGGDDRGAGDSAVDAVRHHGAWCRARSAAT